MLEREGNIYSGMKPTDVQQQKLTGFTELINEPPHLEGYIERQQPQVPVPNQAKLGRKGGVSSIAALLALTVSPDEGTLPDKTRIRKWSLHDIQAMPKARQKEWKAAC
ncbi:hypothetical protein K488DRAFT_75102 [Vararia minispora EC-137]|uniref:Uncharacterized protein n=1 Tax=Vararia minispora EC-137 TaxID=1314806 RepID=A0ACB8Q4Q1_9AGAM|nr:hypothetical protein K488DRAFT_75102 [Vararia minispora EC-137]